MKKISILFLILVLLVTSGLLSCSSEEEPIDVVTLKLGHSQPEDSVIGRSAQKFADLTKKYTDNRVEIEIFPQGLLFKETDELSATIAGAVDIGFTPGFFARSTVPDAGIWYLHGSWEGTEHGMAVLEDGRVLEILGPQMEAIRIKLVGFVLATSGQGAYFIKGREAILREDMDGLRIAVRTGSPGLPFDTYVGMKQVTVPAAEMVSAFVQGVVDVVSTTVEDGVSRKWHEPADYALVYTSASWPAPSQVNFNLESWNSLPADIQDIIVDEVLPEVLEFSETAAQEDYEKSFKILEDELTAVHVEPLDYTLSLTEAVFDDPMLVALRGSVSPELLAVVDELRPSKQ